MPLGATARPGMIRLLFATACFTSATPALARGQIIPIKTARIAEADLSSYMPSANAGMGVLLTVPDSVLDAFNNPAAGRRFRLPYVVGSLASYSVSHDLGNGSTTPIGIFGSRGPWFAGFNGARQSVSPPDLSGFSFGDVVNHNMYGFVLLGRSFGATTVGVSSAWAGQEALDGAELIYPGMRSVDRRDNSRDWRLGLARSFSGGATLEAVVLGMRSSSFNTVRYIDRVWDPNQQLLKETERLESDRDRVATNGVHATITMPLRDTTWRIGGGLTANVVEHTTLPSYAAANLRRDPGTSSAFNGILGFSRSSERVRFGMDAIYEPVWGRISVNGSPNNDRYRFYNTAVRGGVSADYHPIGQQTSVRVLFGAQMRNIRYMKHAVDSAQVVTSSWHAWDEWTHNWGVSFLDKAMSLHLQWRVQSGDRRPGQLNNSSGVPGLLDVAIFPFPSPETTLLPTRVSTLQILATVPIR